MSKTAEKQERPALKLALELGPLVVFFLANKYGEALAEMFPILADLGGKIFVGTALFMVAMVISLVASRILLGTLAVMPLVTGFFVLVFGGLTLYLQNDIFIKMKPTIVNLIFAGILLGGLVFGKSLLAYVFDSAFKLDDAGWKKLTLRWGLFFVCLAILNELVWRNFSTDFWVTFKVWAIMPLSMIFMMAQLPLLKAHSIEPLFGED
ncbi:MAG: septation protein A [Hyphomicrobiales bacterium]|nr:septation protein A [Hyphomicrobiales bacterium]